jgi:uncharacterized cupredoxin-like copper-binding protein
MDTALRRLLPAALASVLVVAAGCAGTGSASSAPVSASSAPLPRSAPTEAAVVMTSEPADEPPPEAIVIVAGPSSEFTPSEIETAAKEPLTFFIDMSTTYSNYFHNFNIGLQLPPGPALATTTDLMVPGESVVVTVSGLAPGTYQFWCSYGEHYKYGMHGTLTVK